MESQQRNARRSLRRREAGRFPLYRSVQDSDIDEARDGAASHEDLDGLMEQVRAIAKDA